ncbi:MAG TPA: AGE family epimerase/isomerase [Nocardioidaceae bacterium]|nr:AGE family epimerase/isomerase [Nocardioidaceae bacterium]
MARLLGDREHAEWLEAEGIRLLDFGRAAEDPSGGFAWLDDRGRPDPGHPGQLWVTARMTHVYALGELLGYPGAAALADHGVDALTGSFRDAVHGGWYAAVDRDGPVSRDKTAYEHAFVVLAAASTVVAGRPGGPGLLEEALDVFLRRFWDEEAGMVVEQWDEPFERLDGYRGVNANMHSVEALLAAADVTGDASLRARALRVTDRVVHRLAAGNSWRIPEHLDASYRPDLDYNRDQPAHPFRPFGATVGHSLEWSRLAVQLHAALGGEAPDWLVGDARHLFETAVHDGWAVDGAPGFVYTVDWDGNPVVRQRMHWVAAESTAAAAALHAATGSPSYAGWYDQWWAYIAASFVDEGLGSWHHELSPDNRPSSLTWNGKPDLYHAFQATLLPRVPLAPTLATALAGGLLR